ANEFSAQQSFFGARYNSSMFINHNDMKHIMKPSMTAIPKEKEDKNTIAQITNFFRTHPREDLCHEKETLVKSEN
ncbi:MAG: hypothetical protein Q8M03_05460, partial [Legionella sp.]|nr:hypothetical protein [Legionella sp.]